MTLYRVRHETAYEYGDPVAISHSLAHLLPRELPTQQLLGLELDIRPAPHTVRWFQDYFGNGAVFFVIDEPHARLVVTTESRVRVAPRAAPRIAESPPWEEALRALHAARDDAALEALEFVFDSPGVPTSAALATYGRPSFPAGRRLLEGAVDLCHRIHDGFRYDTEATTLATPVEEALARRHGVCQDFAQVMIGALRSLGLPARYVSGYLRSRPREAEADEAAGLVGAEASHAWVSVFCPVNGWVDLDPTNDLLPAERHVTLGWGRDYDDVSPVQGVTLGGGLQTVSVAVAVRPVDEHGSELAGA